jgi:mono/diheme cytochrome c family protein
MRYNKPAALFIAGASLTALALLLCAPASGAPVKIELPEEVAALKAGPGVEAAQNNCLTCHSADYINTQPRGPKFGKEFWTAEVTKMITVFGAPIADDDAKKIIDYLAATYLKRHRHVNGRWVLALASCNWRL